MHTAIFMAKQDSLITAAFLLLVVASRLDAQVIETPVPFDSAARVHSLTPALVSRFGVSAPTWPVAGDFVIARLYSVSTGGIVLSVERASGQVERHLLSDEQLRALRDAVDAALGQPTMAPLSSPIVSPGARGLLVRNQMILSALVYGPLVASFADDGKTATALYLLSVGLSFFLANDLARNTTVSRTQSDLATDGVIRGGAGAAGLLYAFGGEEVDRKVFSAVTLAGAIGGSRTGFVYGRRLNDSESQAARKVSTLGAATALGVLGSFGLFEQDNQQRPVIGAMVAAGLAGYVLGPNYPRRVTYNVTAGDVRLLPFGALIGAGLAVTPVLSQDNSQIVWTLATGGMLAGIAATERTWVRRYDHGHADASVTGLGMVAGALLGGAVAVLVDAQEPEAIMGTVSGGAFLGLLAGHSIAKPPRAGPRGASLREPASERVRFDVAALAMSALRVRGSHSLLRITF
jgi:hypothetical protein